MAFLALSINSDLFRYGLLIVTAPLWVPFLKALWEECNDSLREEGGLFGFELTPAQLERINREKGAFQSPLVHEPWDAPESPVTPSRARARASAPQPLRRGFRAEPRDASAHGFRPGGR